VVFSGRVLQVVNGNETGEFRGWRATFQVTRYWKGAPSEEVVVFTGPDDCAAYFEQGQEYLVFAYVPKGERELSTSNCMRTGPVRLKVEYLAWLGRGKISRKRPEDQSSSGKLVIGGTP